MISIARLPSSLFLVLHVGKSMNCHCSLDSPWLLATYAFFAGLCSYECLGALELVHWEFVVLHPSEHLYKFSNTAARSHNEDCQPWHQAVIVICRLSSDEETSGFILGTKNTITVTCQMLSKSSPLPSGHCFPYIQLGVQYNPKSMGSFADPHCIVSTHCRLQQDDALARIAEVPRCNHSLKLQGILYLAQEGSDLGINLCVVEVSRDFAYQDKGVADAMPKPDPIVWIRVLYCLTGDWQTCSCPQTGFEEPIGALVETRAYGSS